MLGVPIIWSTDAGLKDKEQIGLSDGHADLQLHFLSAQFDWITNVDDIIKADSGCRVDPGTRGLLVRQPSTLNPQDLVFDTLSDHWNPHPADYVPSVVLDKKDS